MFVRAQTFCILLIAGGLLFGGPTHARAQEGPAPELITLRTLLQRALVDPPRVLSARAALERADADRRMAQAGYFPALMLQATEGIAYDNRQQVPNPVLDVLKAVYQAATGEELPSKKSNGRMDLVSQQVGGSASLDWSLVNVARRRTIEGATRARDAQQHALAGVQRAALAAACDLYLRALAASELVADANLTLERRSAQHQGVAGLVRAGLRPPVDETRARIEAVAATYRLEVRKVEERAMFAALAVSIGRDPLRPLRPEPLVTSPFEVTHSMQQATALAFEHRPEIQSLRTGLWARQAELSAALWRRAPTLGISGTATASYIDQLRGDGYQGTQYSAAALVYLRVQTFDAGLWRSAEIARANLLQQQRALEASALDVRAEVAEASFAVQRTRAELERATQVLSAAGAAREAQNGRYKTGVASLLELLDAEAVEQNARFDRIQAERDHQLASVRLLSATGLIRRLAQ